MEIAFISGKGGTGKSSICAAFATLDPRVVVADCDVDAANLYLIFNPTVEQEEVFIGGQKAVIDPVKCTQCGICIPYCRFDAISLKEGVVSISPVDCDGCFLCSRICPEDAISMISNDRSRLRSGNFRNGKMVYGWLAPGEENSGKLVSRVREKAKQIARAAQLSTILLDGPPGIGCPVISTVTGTDRVIIVVEATRSGLSDLERVAAIPAGSDINTSVIINKYDLNAEITREISNWCERHAIPVIGLLPYDDEVVRAMVHAKSITEWDPNSDISKEIRNIWQKILNNQ